MPLQGTYMHRWYYTCQFKHINWPNCTSLDWKRNLGKNMQHTGNRQDSNPTPYRHEASAPATELPRKDKKTYRCQPRWQGTTGRTFIQWSLMVEQARFPQTKNSFKSLNNKMEDGKVKYGNNARTPYTRVSQPHPRKPPDGPMFLLKNVDHLVVPMGGEEKLCLMLCNSMG